MYQLIELRNGKVMVLSTGSFLTMCKLKKIMLSKTRGALIIKESQKC